MSLTVEIPTLTTARLTLRAPRLDDFEVFAAFMGTERSRFVGGSPELTRRMLVRGFGHIAGLWVMRGYSLFVMERNGAPIGAVGPWYPVDWTEPEFGWSLWSSEAEGQGYITEAMRVLAPWFWRRSGLTTAISVIDEDNAASIRVAERLGASVDPAATEAANREDSPFHMRDGGRTLVWRHSAPTADAKPTEYRRDTDVPTGGFTNA